MKIGIIGSRDYKNTSKIVNIVRRIHERYPDSILISGGARGPDSIAIEEGLRIGMEKPIVFKPDWDKYGKKAGMLRNSLIVKESDYIVAFYDGISRGTQDSIRKAIQAGKKVYIYCDLSIDVISL
jgi:hypothetical protein